MDQSLSRSVGHHAECAFTARRRPRTARVHPGLDLLMQLGDGAASADMAEDALWPAVDRTSSHWSIEFEIFGWIFGTVGCGEAVEAPASHAC